MNLKKYFSKVKNKITFISFDVIFLYIIIGLVAYYSANKVNEIKNFGPLNDIVSKYSKLRISYYNFLHTDKNKSSFIEKGESLHADEYQKNLDTIFVTIAKIKVDNEELNVLSGKDKQLLDSINLHFKEYSELFSELRSLYIKRGTKNLGTKQKLINLHQRVLTLTTDYLTDDYEEYKSNFSKFTHNLLPIDKELLRNVDEIEQDFVGDSLLVYDNFLLQEIQDVVKTYKFKIKEYSKINASISAYPKHTGALQKIQILEEQIEKDITILKSRIYKTIDKKSSNYNTLVIVLIVLASIFTFFVIRKIRRSIVKPLLSITDYTNKLALGKFPKKLFLDNDDEITAILISMNKLIDGLKEKDRFAQEIENGNLEAKITPLSEDDTLSHSLEDMQKSLKQAHEERMKRQEEEKQQKWINTGIAEFATILRKNTDNLNELGDEIIRNLVHYVGANQGGIFLQDKDKETSKVYMDMIASYAFNRKKFLSKRIELGEGLIGSIALEKKMIHLHKLPEDYLEISSGLGESQPTDLVIIPLIFNEVFYGALEIASFEQLPEYKIEFLKQVVDNIASTFASVKVNIQTSDLLKQSNFQAEELASQEEEMRQNMEELQATQEEASRRELVLQELVTAIDAANFVIEYDTDGKVIRVNDMAAEILASSKEKPEEKSVFNFIGTTNKADTLWATALNGEVGKEVIELDIDNKKLWFDVTLSPIKNEAGRISKIIQFAHDITESKELEEQIKQENELVKAQKEMLTEKLKELNKKEDEIEAKNFEISKLKESIDSSLYYAEFNEKLEFVDVNRRLVAAFNYSQEELKGNSFDVLSTENDKHTAQTILKKLAQQSVYKLKTNKQTKSGQEIFLFLNFSTIIKNNEIVKIILFGHETLK